MPQPYNPYGSFSGGLADGAQVVLDAYGRSQQQELDRDLGNRKLGLLEKELEASNAQFNSEQNRLSDEFGQRVEFSRWNAELLDKTERARIVASVREAEVAADASVKVADLNAGADARTVLAGGVVERDKAEAAAAAARSTRERSAFVTGTEALNAGVLANGAFKAETERQFLSMVRTDPETRRVLGTVLGGLGVSLTEGDDLTVFKTDFGYSFGVVRADGSQAVVSPAGIGAYTLTSPDEGGGEIFDASEIAGIFSAAAVSRATEGDPDIARAKLVATIMAEASSGGGEGGNTPPEGREPTTPIGQIAAGTGAAVPMSATAAPVSDGGGLRAGANNPRSAPGGGAGLGGSSTSPLGLGERITAAGVSEIQRKLANRAGNLPSGGVVGPTPLPVARPDVGLSPTAMATLAGNETATAAAGLAPMIGREIADAPTVAAISNTVAGAAATQPDLLLNALESQGVELDKDELTALISADPATDPVAAAKRVQVEQTVARLVRLFEDAVLASPDQRAKLNTNARKFSDLSGTEQNRFVLTALRMGSNVEGIEGVFKGLGTPAGAQLVDRYRGVPISPGAQSHQVEAFTNAYMGAGSEVFRQRGLSRPEFGNL